MGTMLSDIGNFTDIGVEPTENQDYMGYFPLPLGELFMVCDGMGGAKGGRQASTLAVTIISQTLQEFGPETAPTEALGRALLAANEGIHQTSQANPDLRGMGSTCVALLIQDLRLAYLAHVGDSRIYRIRHNQIQTMTKDHTVVQRMVDQGLLAPEEAENHPDANVISRSLGPKAEVEPEVRPEPLPIEEGDTFLLCTDGLTSLVQDEEILHAVLTSPSAQDACQVLCQMANQRGGYDNTTVQVIRFFESPDSAPEPRPTGTPIGSSLPMSPPVPQAQGYLGDENALEAKAEEREEPLGGPGKKGLGTSLILAGVILAALLVAVGVFVLGGREEKTDPAPQPTPRAPVKVVAPAPEPKEQPPSPRKTSTRKPFKKVGSSGASEGGKEVKPAPVVPSPLDEWKDPFSPSPPPAKSPVPPQYEKIKSNVKIDTVD